MKGAGHLLFLYVRWSRKDSVLAAGGGPYAHFFIYLFLSFEGVDMQNQLIAQNLLKMPMKAMHTGPTVKSNRWNYLDTKN